MITRYSGEAFKRSIVNFAAGRSFNALAAFLTFIWIARQLPSSEYAIYVAAFALLEVGLIVAGFGMEWVTAVYVPQVRLNASGKALRKFTYECAAIQCGTLFAGAGILYVSAPELSRWFGLSDATSAFRVYAVVMLIEGVSRVVRDQLLSCLLLQGAAQISQFARNVVLLAAVVWMFADERSRTAEGLAFAEICASATSLALAFWLLGRYLGAAKDEPPAAGDWTMPRWIDLFKVARNAWVSNLANLTWGWNVVVLLVARMIGAEGTAALGFARNLAEQVRRYMPMEFLFGIMRTLIVARFSRDRDLRRLGVRIGFMYKANLLVLLPLLAAAIVGGDAICDLISGGRYASAHWYLVGWLSVLVALAHHRLTDLLAHALNRSELTLRASLLMTATPLAVLLCSELGVWTLLFFVLLAAETTYSAIVIGSLGAAMRGYSPDWTGLGKLAIAAALAAGTLLLLPREAGLWPILLLISVAYAVFWSTLWLLKALTVEEVAMLPARVRHWAFGRSI